MRRPEQLEPYNGDTVATFRTSASTAKLKKGIKWCVVRCSVRSLGERRDLKQEVSESGENGDCAEAMGEEDVVRRDDAEDGKRRDGERKKKVGERFGI